MCIGTTTGLGRDFPVLQLWKTLIYSTPLINHKAEPLPGTRLLHYHCEVSRLYNICLKKAIDVFVCALFCTICRMFAVLTENQSKR